MFMREKLDRIGVDGQLNGVGGEGDRYRKSKRDGGKLNRF